MPCFLCDRALPGHQVRECLFAIDLNTRLWSIRPRGLIQKLFHIDGHLGFVCCPQCKHLLAHERLYCFMYERDFWRPSYEARFGPFKIGWAETRFYPDNNYSQSSAGDSANIESICVPSATSPPTHNSLPGRDRLDIHVHNDGVTISWMMVLLVCVFVCGVIVGTGMA